MRIIKKKNDEQSTHNDISEDSTNNDLENSSDNTEIPPPTKRRCIPSPNTGYNSDDEYNHSKSNEDRVVFSLFEEIKKKVSISFFIIDIYI